MTKTIIFESLEKIRIWANNSSIEQQRGFYVVKNPRDGLYYYFQMIKAGEFKLVMSSQKNVLNGA